MDLSADSGTPPTHTADAETRFEDQIGKLVLEKQELEWEKESLQHQNETVSNQHTDSLIKVKKEKMALIPLSVCNFTLSQEQKMSLQSRSKDSHLNQLGEVEKRFAALSRQCAVVKQAHEKLEQNVDEAVKIQKKLTAANEKQEATVVSLKKELEEVSHNVVKAKMSSARHGEAHGATGREQHCEQLHRKLSLEVMRALQHGQQLLLSQTQAVSRVELALQTQREQYQKSMFLGCIQSERQDREAVKQAHAELQREHAELSLQAKVQAQHIYELEMRVGGRGPGAPTEDSRAEGTLNEPVSRSGRLQHLACAPTSSPDALEDTGVVTERDATGATGDEGQQRHGKGEDEKKGGGAAEKRGATEGEARRQGGPGSAEDAGGAKRPEAATEDRGEGEGTHGAETQIEAQTTADMMAEESDTQPAVDLVDAEPPPPAACESSDRSHSLLQSVGEEEEEEEEAAAPSFAMEGHETPSGLRRGVDDEPHCVAQEAQSLRHDAVQTVAESASPSPIHHALEKPTEEEPLMNSAANMSTELSGSGAPAPSAAQSDGVGLQELATAQTPPGEMKRTEASPPCPEINDDSRAYGEREDPENSDTHGNDALEAQTPTAECTLKDAGAADLETGGGREEATANRIDGAGDTKGTQKGADSQPPVQPSHESDATPETGDTKCLERSPAKETSHGDASELPLLGSTTYRPAFDWRAPRERTGSSRDTADASVPRQFVQVTKFKWAKHQRLKGTVHKQIVLLR
ncbi:Coiled-coil domain-containing protein 73 [Liparis tanakae]|uniref:Coiled-coil domain-containing protein 73 n=1 Tax=Liparis tanakae TaxID=230148 RepID=A0A4Z2I7B7_9TELE|nr:Coiled-coil domain-containing protein 73 [Liparis tanakae]